jgi:predicted nucleic acid-binding protein
LIVDNLKARKLSEKVGIDYTGTFGIIIYAKKTGVIASVIPILDKIKQTNFRLSDSLVNEILKMAGEAE